jgi:hypothetical protein
MKRFVNQRVAITPQRFVTRLTPDFAVFLAAMGRVFSQKRKVNLLKNA